MGFISINRQGRACRAVSRKVLDDRWVPDNPLVLEDSLIRDYCQGEACCAVLGKVPDDPLVPDDLLIRDDR